MTCELITSSVWEHITAAAKRARTPSFVCVAYFGQGASKMLPIPRGSRLVVDASLSAVASGQTSPAELEIMMNNGVKIFCRPHVHAKLFVFGRRAFVGSANASSRSANLLIEAVLATTEPESVSQAREFVKDLCDAELSTEAIVQLKENYRPPLITGEISRRASRNGPGLRLIQLVREEFSPEIEASLAQGELEARKRRRHTDSHVIESFLPSRALSSFQLGDLVVQITNEAGGQRLVSPPAEVISIMGIDDEVCVFVETPNRRRINFKEFVRRVGKEHEKDLIRSVRVRNAKVAERILRAFSTPS